jgi:hypothetical protein
MHICCYGNPFTKQLTNNSPGIVDMFTSCYLETGLSTYCIATAVLIACFEVSAQQRAYTPHYLTLWPENDRREGRAGPLPLLAPVPTLSLPPCPCAF